MANFQGHQAGLPGLVFSGKDPRAWDWRPILEDLCCPDCLQPGQAHREPLGVTESPEPLQGGHTVLAAQHHELLTCERERARVRGR